MDLVRPKRIIRDQYLRFPPSQEQVPILRDRDGPFKRCAYAQFEFRVGGLGVCNLADEIIIGIRAFEVGGVDVGRRAVGCALANRSVSDATDQEV